jgi:hypothetical protein
MFKHYINLELKAFFVRLVWEKHWLKKFDGFFSSLFFTCFLWELHCIPCYQKPPGSKPLAIVNSYVIFWLAIELIFRFFMQSLPVMNIKPLLCCP